MSRIAGIFRRRKALISFLTVGYPSVERTVEIVPRLAAWGCDLVELGIPFSDPLADGATIQRASHQALQNGVTPGVCLEVAARVRRTADVPLVFMTYYNPVLSYGLRDFCRASARSGVQGLIVPDLPPEEGAELEEHASESGLDLIYLLAPTSPDRRIDLVAARSRGFIYIVSLAGVTGTRQSLPADLSDFVKKVRSRSSLPLCVGFGISTPEQAKAIAAFADGVIIGSRLIEMLNGEETAQLAQFIQQTRSALDEKTGPVGFRPQIM